MNKLLLYLVLIPISIVSYSQNYSVLDFYDLTNAKQIILNKKLEEISGITFNDKNNLFAHDDERGKIYQLNISNGKVIKDFYLDKKKDFEDIAFYADRFYLVSSSGDIYEFEEGEDEEKIDYEKYETHLNSDNDVEGLCVDKDSLSLLLICKEDPGKDFKGYRAVYKFNLRTKELYKAPTFLISIDQVKSMTGRKDFNPSAIEYNKILNQYFILDGKGISLVIISGKGDLVTALALDKDLHSQPEGLIFSESGTMIIADEGRKGKPKITFYEPSNKKNN